MHVGNLIDWELTSLITNPFSDHCMGYLGRSHHHPHQPATENRIGRAIVVWFVSWVLESDQLYQICRPRGHCRVEVELHCQVL